MQFPGSPLMQMLATLIFNGFIDKQSVALSLFPVTPLWPR